MKVTTNDNIVFLQIIFARLLSRFKQVGRSIQMSR